MWNLTEPSIETKKFAFLSIINSVNRSGDGLDHIKCRSTTQLWFKTNVVDLNILLLELDPEICQNLDPEPSRFTRSHYQLNTTK